MSNHDEQKEREVEIVGPDGRVHYRRPMNHPDVTEALARPGYYVRGTGWMMSHPTPPAPSGGITVEDVDRITGEAILEWEQMTQGEIEKRGLLGISGYHVAARIKEAITQSNG